MGDKLIKIVESALAGVATCVLLFFVSSKLIDLIGVGNGFEDLAAVIVAFGINLIVSILTAFVAHNLLTRNNKVQNVQPADLIYIRAKNKSLYIMTFIIGFLLIVELVLFFEVARF